MSDNIGFLVSDVARLIRRRFEERASVIGITLAMARTYRFASQRRYKSGCFGGNTGT